MYDIKFSRVRVYSPCIFISVACAFLISCASPHVATEAALNEGVTPSVLSYGMVKKHVEIGKTSQAEVVKLFGAANNMTIDAKGSELWIYDQFYSESQVSTSSSGGGIGVLGGAGGGDIAGGGLAGVSKSNSSSHRKSAGRTLTVIIEFDKQGIVSDYSARSGGY